MLKLDPAVPDDWASFTIEYRIGTTRYVIEVTQPAAVARRGAQVQIDGEPVSSLTLADDGDDHRVLIQPTPETGPA